jgi:hypothetical protein
MEHERYVLQGPLKKRAIEDASFVHLDVIADVGEILSTTGADIVDDPDAVAAMKESSYEVGSDEARASGNQTQRITHSSAFRRVTAPALTKGVGRSSP